MAHPKRKHSHQRSAKRRTHFTTEMLELSATKNVQGDPLHVRHCASKDGYYKGRRLPGYKEKE